MAPDATFPAASLSVLVLADHPSIWKICCALTSDGIDVVLLTDPAHAIERIRNAVFHLVILDLTMPKIDGLTLIRQIRELNDDIEIIAMISAPPPLEATEPSIRPNQRRSAAARWYHPVTEYIYHPVGLSEIREAFVRIAKRRPLASSNHTYLS